MRFTRAGKSTHQRVPQEATSWEELKNTPAKKSGTARKSLTKSGIPSKKPKNGVAKDKNRNFRRQRKEEISANFVELGPRLKPNETNNEPLNAEGEDSKSSGGKKKRKVLGSGQSKQVRILGQFWVPVEDAKRLKALQKKLRNEGLSKKQIEEALKNERRKAEKTARRARDKTCYNCRQFGHVLQDCPNSKSESDKSVDTSSLGEICFKCGSTEHLSRHCRKSADKFDFAKCFVCSKSGHIARQCPENTKGIYPTGGSCNECGESTHLAKDCPTLLPSEKLVKKSDGDDAVATRISNPFTSPEFEEFQFDVEPTEAKSEVSQESKPKVAKGRKVKF